MRKLLLLSFLLLMPLGVRAACTGSSPIWNSTPDSASLQACINSAVAGDTINISGVSATWGLNAVSINKAITLNGAGMGITVITETGNPTFNVTKPSSGVLRIKNMTFSSATGAGNLPHPLTINGGWPSNGAVVFQSVEFITNNDTSIDNFVAGGVIFSLINWHSTTYGDFFMTIKDLTHTSSWTTANSLGTNDTTGLLNNYVEDSTFNGGANGVFDCDDNCRIVVRHNTFKESGGFNSHGHDSSPYGMREFEIYNNNFTFPDKTCANGTTSLSNINQYIWIRGASGVIYNNQTDSLFSGCWNDKPEARFNNRGAEDDRPGGISCAADTYPVSHQLGQDNNGVSDFTNPIYLWGNTSNDGADSGGTWQVAVSSGWGWGNPCSFNWNTYFLWGRDAINTTVGSITLSANGGTVDGSGGTPKPGYTAYPYPHPLVAGQPTLSFSPSPAVFSAQTVGTTSSPLTITVTNTSSSPQVMATPYFTITGTNSSNFSNAGTGTCANGATVAPSGTCTVNVTFTPSAIGGRTATLTIQGTNIGTDTLSGTGATPVIAISPSPGAFGNQRVNTTSGPLTVTVSNTGTASEILATPFFTLTGTNASDFARSGGTCANAGTIAASSSCTILLTFTPAAIGARTASLNIAGTVNALASITGTGTQAALSFSPSPGAFGNQNINTTSSPLTITVTNNGTASEVLSTPYFTLTGTNSANFANAGTGTCANGGTIAVSGTCTVNLTFTPSAAGARSGTLNISGTVNGSDSLTGTGIAALASLSPLSIAFSNQTTNTSSGNNAVTLTNTGTATLTIASISLTGADSGQFSTNGSTCGASLTASASCSLNVVFTPTTVGSKSASLVFVTNAASSPDTVALTGTGVAPAVPVINLSPNPVPFGSQLQNTTSSPITVTVSNSGTASEVLGTPFFTLTGTNSGDFARSGGTCVNGGTVAVSGSCTVILTFTPTGTGSRSGILNISGTVNGSDALTGTGTLPVIGLSPSPGAFGNQLQGTTSAPLTITVSNTGTAAEVLATPFFTITGTNPTNFARSGGTCVNAGSIAASSSCTIILTFTPSATGARSATLTIQGTVNAIDSLTGTGTLPVIGLAPSPAAFGNQAVSTTSSPVTVTLSNTGTASEVLSTPFFTITGTNAADFARSGGTCANAGTVAASGSCTILLTFTPSASGARTATLNISGTVNATDSLTGTGTQAALTITPSPGAFGNQNVNTTSGPLTITVANSGTVNQVFATPYFTLTGTNAANFANAGTGTCSNGGTVIPFASCTVDLTFTPSASGARTATLNILGTVNSSDSLTGTGIAAALSLNPTSIAFGNQTTGTSSGNHAVTLTNSGTATLNISSITFTGANSAEFSINSNTCSSTLAAAASCTLNVVFSPTSAVAKTASVTFTTDASTSPDNVSLTGTGVVPAVPAISFSPSPGAFGSQLQNTTSSPLTVTVSNIGTASEILANPFFTITGSNSGDFVRSGGTCTNSGTIAASGSCTVILTFTPTASGSRTATLNILGTANGSNALTGTGTQPVLSFSPSPGAFGDQTQGTTSSPLTITVTNSGTAPQVLATPYFVISGANATNFANANTGTCANGGSIAASSSCTVKLTFTPSVTGNLTATLNIQGTVNSSDTLTGRGTPLPIVTIGLASIAFGNQDDGTSSSPTNVTMSNTGLGTLNITSISLTGTNASEFSINSNTCGTTLGPSTSCNWNVVFSPVTAGAKSASVTVITNAGSSPDFVTLTGTGRVPTPPNTPAPAITIVTILPPGSVVVSATGGGVTPRNLLVSASGCSQDGITYSNPCRFSISCGNCSQKTSVRFNGTLVSTSYFKSVITASVPITLLPVPSVATDYQFSLTN